MTFLKISARAFNCFETHHNSIVCVNDIQVQFLLKPNNFGYSSMLFKRQID